jgi:asparagine synthase (glutamine-hydrolysing)
MCGIAGFVAAPGRQLPQREQIGRALEAMRHRGPDDEGTAVVDGAVLLHRRLSIVDVAGGAQPMANEDGTVLVVFNGEIWNHLELRRLLERAGHSFRTRCDTEVLVHGYEEWGANLLGRLDGMFAFGIWDTVRGRLLLARDRTGKKPVYLTRTRDGLAFGSDARVVLQLAGVEPRLDRDHVAQFLFQRYLTAPATLWRGVEKLAAGTSLVWENGVVHSERYWAPPPTPAPSLDAGELRGALRLAAGKRLMADVPIGVLLSGGIDSAAVLGLAHEAGARQLSSFTIGFRDAVYDERGLARVTAKRFGTEHHELVVGAGDFAGALARLAWYRDEPIAEPSEVPLLLLAEHAGRHVKVVLCGDGGDELFGGYPKYRVDPLLRLRVLPTPLLVRAGLAVLHGRPTHRRLGRAAATVTIRDPLVRWASWFRSFDLPTMRRLLADGMPPVTSESLTQPLRAALDGYDELDPGARMLLGDLRTYLPDNMLARGDKVLMAASVEGRMPFLDAAIVERVSASPSRDRATLRAGKKVLRQAVRDLIPPEVARAPKRGFPLPLRSLLLGASDRLVERVLLSDRCLERGILDPDALRAFVAAAPLRPDGELELFTLCSLELWFRTAVDRLTVQPPESLDELLDSPAPVAPALAGV